MSNAESSRRPNVEGFKFPSWLIVVVIVAILGFTWWQSNHAKLTNEPVNISESRLRVGGNDHDSSATLPEQDDPTHSEIMPEDVQPAERPQAMEPHSGPHKKVSTGAASDATKPAASDRHRRSEQFGGSSLQVENQTIRDLNGKVVYQGTIDLKPTLDRIDRGESNRHRNDGSSFQNREDRLPRKPAGYYKEYVQPTPGEHGPGPQRIIIGKEGEVWYTADHYKTFKQIR